MVIFIEEILNGKLHFFCSIKSLAIRIFLHVLIIHFLVFKFSDNLLKQSLFEKISFLQPRFFLSHVLCKVLYPASCDSSKNYRNLSGKHLRQTLLLVNYRLYAVKNSLREKCPDTELFQVRVFLIRTRSDYDPFYPATFGSSKNSRNLSGKDLWQISLLVNYRRQGWKYSNKNSVKDILLGLD